MKNEIIDRYVDRLLAESSPESPLWNIERCRNGEKPKWNYIDGCMMMALIRLYETTKETKYIDFVHQYLDIQVGEDGSLLGYDIETYNLDNIFSGNALIDVYKLFEEDKLKKAMDNLNSQLYSQPRTSTNNYWHKLIYPNQVWLDGLYMAQVYRARYGNCFDDNSAYDDIYMQFTNVRKYMFDENKKLYVHGYDDSRDVFWAQENGQSKNIWLRAVGWYAAAIVDVLESYPTDRQDEIDWLRGMLEELLLGMMQYIDEESGMFLQVVDYPMQDGNYPETSGSSLIAYAMMKAARLGYIGDIWSERGMSIFDSICVKYLKEQDGQLSLGGICLVSGLGPQSNRRRDGSYEYYISEPIVENEAKGIAPFLYCYSESLYK